MGILQPRGKDLHRLAGEIFPPIDRGIGVQRLSQLVLSLFGLHVGRVSDDAKIEMMTNHIKMMIMSGHGRGKEIISHWSVHI